METNIQRKVLGSAQRKTPTTNQYPTQNKHRRSFDGGLNHHIYLDSIVNTWSGEPAELFRPKNWKHWIKKEAKKRDNHDKFLSDEALGKFAETLMDLIFDENKPHLDLLRKRFRPDQRERFQKLKKDYDDKENLKLLKEMNPGSISTFAGDDLSDPNSGDDGFSIDDDKVVEEGEIEEEELFKDADFKRTRHPKRIESSDDEFSGELFRDPPNSIGHNKGVAGSYSRTPRKVKLTKRRMDDGRKDVTSRKKQRSKENEALQNGWMPPLQQLEIRRVPISKPKSVYVKECTDRYNSLNNDKHPKSSSYNSRLDENGIKDALNTVSIEDNEETDVLFENSTPPFSPPPIFHRNHGEPERPKKRKVELQHPSEVQSNRFRSAAAPLCYKKAIGNVLDNLGTKPQSQYRRNEKENPRYREKRLLYPKPGGTKYRNEPFTQTSSNKRKPEEVWLPDGAPDNEHLVNEEEKENFPVSVEEIGLKYPKPLSAPTLTLEMFDVIKKTLEKPAKEKVVSGFSLTILQEDLVIISKNTEWLIDLNIDFYLELIRERSKEEGYPKVYIFHSFFYTLLQTNCGYGAVQGTTGEDDILQFDLLLIPVVINDHWRLVVVKVQEKLIECYDSMAHSNKEILKNIEAFLRRWEYFRTEEASDRANSTTFNEENNTANTTIVNEENSTANTTMVNEENNTANTTMVNEEMTSIGLVEEWASNSSTSVLDVSEKEKSTITTVIELTEEENSVANLLANEVIQADDDVIPIGLIEEVVNTSELFEVEENSTGIKKVQEEEEININTPATEQIEDKRVCEENGNGIPTGEIAEDIGAITICPSSQQDEIDTEEKVQEFLRSTPSPWTRHSKSKDSIPQQTNAIDCGIFILQFAEYLSRQRDFDFDQSHIPYFRKRMMYETLTKKLLT